jgi:hypothetical protein
MKFHASNANEFFDRLIRFIEVLAYLRPTIEKIVGSKRPPRTIIVKRLKSMGHGASAIL